MLQLLSKRNDYLCEARFDKAEEIETKLTETKNQKYDDLVVPNYFFCTFMEGKGCKAAIDQERIDCDGITVDLKEAKNPSDILWLNKGVAKSSQCKRGIIVTLIIAIVSWGVFWIF